ncbi:hypothetical protein GCM10023116_10950 [Kistimonas scapharcae]|uniref:Type II secretion system protein H n=1 Tax=Kistimonas scapharcae TaxID=1036133 RepID=A0ABP8UYV7_9GAMM
MSHHKGFTLIELMITLAIASILLGIGIPSFQGFMAENRVRTHSSALQHSLLYARSEAIKRNALISVAQINNDWSNGWAVQAGGQVLKQYTPDNNIQLTPDNTATQFIFFLPDGSTLNGETFTITSDGKSQQVSISLAGQIL